MLREWRIGLFTAQRKALALAAICAVITILAGVLALASVLVASATASPVAPASQKFSTTAKVQTIADGLHCVKLGHDCADFDATVAYLGSLIDDKAVYASAPTGAAQLTKTPSGWQSWADKILSGTLGSPRQLSETGQSVTFTWGGNSFEAAFTTSGDDQRLIKLTKGARAS